jgi:uncharacterized protein (TIGR03435 family)
MSLDGLAAFLNAGRGLLDLSVVNMTGIPGRYHVDLDISQNDLRALIPPELQPLGVQDGSGPDLGDPPGRSIYTSLDKLGLRLERSKAPVEQLIVDHVEKVPTSN